MLNALQHWWFITALIAKRGLGWLTVLAVISSGLFVMFMRGMMWRGDLVWTIDWVSLGFVICGPLLAGCVALDTGLLSRGMAHLETRTFARPTVAIAGAHATLAIAAQLAVLALALLLSLPPALPAVALLAITVQLLLLALFVSIGALVGRVTKPVSAGLLSSGLVLILVYVFAYSSKQINILDTGGLATISRVGYTYNWVFLTIQALIICAVIAASWIVQPNNPVVSTRIARPRAIIAFVLAMSSIGFGLTQTIPRLIGTSYPPTSCGGVHDLPVCYYPEHATASTKYTEALAGIVIMTEANGYQDLLPTSFMETNTLWYPKDPHVAPFQLTDEDLTGGEPNVELIISQMVQPLHCAQLGTDDPLSEQYGMDVERLTTTWIVAGTTSAQENPGAFKEILTPAEAAALMKSFRTCTYPHFHS